MTKIMIVVATFVMISTKALASLLRGRDEGQGTDLEQLNLKCWLSLDTGPGFR